MPLFYWQNFYDDDGSLIAWSWIGLSKFEGVIKEELNDTNNYMRSIRLRKGNIQIGGEDTLQNLFAEDRGNHYFIGEVFALDNKLIPNAQRDYFIENPNLKYIEKKVTRVFHRPWKNISQCLGD
ncbi:MAG: hypothetical protein K6G55_00070 [Selenomonadaceae bacterium]|nr:hypothetical protein [Selenomonadaceae bacterium]